MRQKNPEVVGLVEAYSNKSADAARLWKLARLEPSRSACADKRIVPRKARQLTEEERRAFVEAYERGELIADIAARLGVHRTTLDMLVQRLRLTREDPRQVPASVRDETVELYRAGMSLSGLGSRFGFSANKVQRLLVAMGEPVRRRGPRMKGSPLTDEQIRAAIADYEQGSSIASIAQRFGVSYPTLRKALMKAGVELRSRGGAQ